MIHRRDCDLLEQFDSEWFDVEWDRDADEDITAVGRLIFVANNEPGVLGQVASITARHEANITNLRFLSQDDFFAEIAIDIAVKDVDHLNRIIESLSMMDEINSIRRAQSTDSIQNPDYVDLAG